MRYPVFLETNGVIGVTAMSAGVGEYSESFNLSIKNICDNGFLVIETASVRVDGVVSNTGSVRASEFDELVLNDDVDMIMCACGGDFALEMLPYVNEKSILSKPKWIMGASDPTSLLYYVTTKLDIATMYGFNAGSFDIKNLHMSNKVCFEYLKGNLVEQNSYGMYESNRNSRTLECYNLDKEILYENINGDMDITGRIIGGCIDVLKDLIGTKYDGTKEFVEKYKADGIIWYFDNFSLGTDVFYRTLIQMREAGWFDYAKGIIVGRVMYPQVNFNMTYQDALRKAINNIPIVFNFDVGHVVPKMVIINGAIANVKVSDGKGSINFLLK